MNKRSILQSVLTQNSYWVVNKKVSNELDSNDAAIVLSEFIYLDSLCTDETLWFEVNCEYLEERCNLSRRRREGVFEILKSKQVVEFAQRGLPKKLYAKINCDNIFNLIENERTHNYVQNVHNGMYKTYTINILNNKDIKQEEKKEIIKEKKEENPNAKELTELQILKQENAKLKKQLQKNENKPTDLEFSDESMKYITEITKPSQIKEKRGKKEFTPPTLEQVIEYCKEKNAGVEYAKHIFEYYNNANWVDSQGQKVLNWKSKILANWLSPSKIQQFNYKNNVKDGSDYFKKLEQELQKKQVGAAENKPRKEIDFSKNDFANF